MKVRATREGYYDNITREPGEVFELLGEAAPDGTHPDFADVESPAIADAFGEPNRFGWMEEVSDDIECGLYPPELSLGDFRPQPLARVGKAISDPIHAKPKGSSHRPTLSAPKR